MIIYNKLVRDKVPKIIIANGQVCTTETLSDIDYHKRLDLKLDEQCAEYHKCKSPEQLADILEVVYSIAATQGISAYELEQIRKDKADRRGSFDKKILLKAVI